MERRLVLKLWKVKAQSADNMRCEEEPERRAAANCKKGAGLRLFGRDPASGPLRSTVPFGVAEFCFRKSLIQLRYKNSAAVSALETAAQVSSAANERRC